MAAPPDKTLQRTLKQRHMSMIALGGVIGAGLFVGSRVVIQSAGPAAVISFLITGLLVVLVMRMLGEMAASPAVFGSFYAFACDALGDFPGFLTGWMYWYFWVIVVAVEAIAGADLIRFWLPAVPQWVLAGLLLAVLTLSNLVSARAYGEFEFWLASIKVVAIAAFLAVGTVFVSGLWPGTVAHVANLTGHGGFMPNGILPVLTGAVAATGFYFGAEIVTVAAAEAEEPATAVAKATNSVISRVLFFYICSITLVVCIVPWNAKEIATPYVSALRAIGLPGAADIMNGVILTAVLSALNSGLYVSSRMLFALTRNGHAPAGLARLSSWGVPVRAILLGTMAGLGAVVMSYVSPDLVFPFLINSYGTVALFVYLLIALSQLRLRARLERESPETLTLRMWGYPWLTWVAIAGMVAILGAMAFIPDQQMPLLFGGISLAALSAFYGLRPRRRATT
jgi:GABA permease